MTLRNRLNKLERIRAEEARTVNQREIMAAWKAAKEQGLEYNIYIRETLTHEEWAEQCPIQAGRVQAVFDMPEPAEGDDPNGLSR
jgi:hypothetical protein